MRLRWIVCLALLACAVLLARIALCQTEAPPRPTAAGAYDPLAVDEKTIETLDLIVHDAARDRDIPVLVYLPESADPQPGVLFSHGLGGTRKGSTYLGKHWAARGYVAVFTQHPGSDDSVWRDLPLRERMAAMNAAASAENFALRVKDIPAVLDALEAWNVSPDHALSGRLDTEHVAMTGHSFGAVTTQAVSGQSFPGVGQRLTDSRIDAAIPFSPSSPRAPRDLSEAFGSVAIPWMLMTGTEDVSPIGDQDVASRLAVFPALPPGDKYELVLDGARHSVFADGRLPGDRGQRDPNHHRAILALSTAFLDAYLREDPDALAWLQGDGPRTVLKEADRWQTK